MFKKDDDKIVTPSYAVNNSMGSFVMGFNKKNDKVINSEIIKGKPGRKKLIQDEE